jgi:hypothetical protein
MRGEIYEPMGTYNYEDITKGFSIHNGNLNPVMSTLRITTHSASSLKPEPTFTRRLWSGPGLPLEIGQHTSTSSWAQAAQGQIRQRPKLSHSQTWGIKRDTYQKLPT